MPPRILKLMLTQGMDMAQASNASGISQDPKLGEGEGLIGATPIHTLTWGIHTPPYVLTLLSYYTPLCQACCRAAESAGSSTPWERSPTRSSSLKTRAGTTERPASGVLRHVEGRSWYHTHTIRRVSMHCTYHPHLERPPMKNPRFAFPALFARQRRPICSEIVGRSGREGSATRLADVVCV